MNTIIHPETGKIYNILSNEGLYIIDRYMNTYKSGGDASNLDDLIERVDVLTGGMKRSFNLFADILSSPSSGSDEDELMPLLSEKKELDMKKRKAFITTLPLEIQEDIDNDSWSGSSSGIHRKDVTDEINLVETDNYFYKFIPEIKIAEIDNIYEILGEASMQMRFPTEFYLPLFKYPLNVTINDEEYGIYRLEKWGESLEDIKRRGEFYHSDTSVNAPFQDVMVWLREVLGYLYSIGITHGDIFKSASEIHWGNILAKQEYGVWEFKLIDFGNEMTDREIEILFYNNLFLETNNNYVMLENKVREDEERNPRYKRRKNRDINRYTSYFSPPKRVRRLFESSEEETDVTTLPPLPPNITRSSPRFVSPLSPQASSAPGVTTPPPIPISPYIRPIHVNKLSFSSLDDTLISRSPPIRASPVSPLRNPTSRTTPPLSRFSPTSRTTPPLRRKLSSPIFDRPRTRSS